MTQSYKPRRKTAVNPDVWLFYMVTQNNERHLTGTQTCKRPARTKHFQWLKTILTQRDEIGEIGYVRASASKDFKFVNQSI